MRNYFVIFLSIIAFTSKELFPQIILSSKAESYYDDNIFNNSLKVSDLISTFELNGGYNLESENNNIQFYSMNNFNSYKNNIYKTSNSHKLGIVDTYLLGGDTNPINIGINYSFKNNRDEFTIFDFNQLSAYINYRHSLNETDYLTTGYLFNRNNYKNLSAFSFNENKAFVKYANTFQTKTTLQLGSEIYFKNYIEKFYYQPKSNSTSQASFSFNISQSLTEQTGISGFFNLRKNIKSGTRYLYSGDLIFYEEEIFNDIYSNDGFETGIAFTQIINSLLTARIEANYSTKYFSNLYAADLDGYELGSLRKDNLFSLGLEFKFDLENYINGLGATILWNYFNNKSNDVFYKYDNHIFLINFEWGM